MDEQIEQKVEVVPSANPLEQLERAAVEVQITTAKQYPRQIGQVKRDMLSFATLDEETAAACFYTLPRGGKTIQGPSVRLAEIALSCYGNIKAGTRVVEVVNQGATGHVVVQALCHDLQNNVAISIEKRRVITKKRSAASIGEDDINLAVNACSAIAMRDAVFKVVPGALIRPVFEAAKSVAVGDVKTLASRRDMAFDRFAKMGVGKDRVLAILDRKTADDVTLSDLETLVGLFTAIRDGQTTIDEAFGAVKVDLLPKKKAAAQAPVETPVGEQIDGGAEVAG